MCVWKSENEDLKFDILMKYETCKENVIKQNIN